MMLEDLYRLLKSGHVQAQGVVDTMTQSIIVLDHNLSVTTAQALALPEGSVRAVIALCLLVLFAILSIYLYGHLATPTPIQAFAGLTGADKDNLIKTFSAGDLVSITGSEAEKFTVYVRQSVSPESVDFAKQILVMLGTLVASISSFYFGSRTAESAGSKGDSPGPSLSDPTISSVSPSATVRSSVAKSILIIGQNLGGIQSVSLSNGLRLFTLRALPQRRRA